jgi:hypothetical protein
MNRWMPAGVLSARNVRNSDGVNAKLPAFLFEREFREAEKRESVLINFVSFVLRQLSQCSGRRSCKSLQRILPFAAP